MLRWGMLLLMSPILIVVLLLVLFVVFCIGYVICGRFISWRLLRLFPIVFEQASHLSDEQMIAQSNELRRFRRLLQLYTVLVVGPCDKNSEKIYTRVHPCLVYNIKRISGSPVAFFHLRAWPPESLREKFDIYPCRDAFIHFVDEVLSQGQVDHVEGITHQHLFNKRVIDRKIVPYLHELGYETFFESYDNDYLPHIYGEFLLVYGMDLFETARGIRLLRTAQEVVRLTIRPRQEQTSLEIEEASVTEVSPTSSESILNRQP